MRNARARESAAIKDFKIPPSQSVRTRQRFHTSFSKSICPTNHFPPTKEANKPLKSGGQSAQNANAPFGAWTTEGFFKTLGKGGLV